LAFLTTKISELIGADCILELDSTTKESALAALSRQLKACGKIADCEAFCRALIEREELASTGVGFGIAIPHVKNALVSDYIIAIGRSKAGLDFDAIDGNPVHLVFMIGASDRQTREFVNILAAVTRLLKSVEVRDALMAAAIPGEFMNVIRENER
jgi:fructose-specific phosphotransferase system IIA component